MLPYAVCLLAGFVIGYFVFYFTANKREKEHVESENDLSSFPVLDFPNANTTLHRRGSHTQMIYDHHQHQHQLPPQQHQPQQQTRQEQPYFVQHQKHQRPPPLPRPSNVATATTSASTSTTTTSQPVLDPVPLNALFPPPPCLPPPSPPPQPPVLGPKPSSPPQNKRGRQSPGRRTSNSSSTSNMGTNDNTTTSAVDTLSVPVPVPVMLSRQATPDMYLHSTTTPSRSRTASIPPTAATINTHQHQPQLQSLPQPHQQNTVVNAYHPQDNKKKEEDQALQLHLNLPLPAQVHPLPPSTPAADRSFPDSQFVSLDMKDIELVKIIGGGAFGQVWRGVWLGTPVAVKVLSSACQAEVPLPVLQAFRDEVQMLARLRHPNICLFLGACLDPPCRTIVTEIVSRGSLWDALRTPHLFENRGRGDIFHWPWWVIRRVLDGTCRGLVYLHGNQPPIIHRDLKSANLLLDDSFNVKICDFGLARLRDFTTTMTANVGTAQWTAPEVLAGKEYNESADMYSLGIVAWELLTGKCPYDHISNQVEIAVNVAHHHVRPTLSEQWPKQVKTFIEKCWSEQPQSRLSALEALKQLETVIPVI